MVTQSLFKPKFYTIPRVLKSCLSQFQVLTLRSVIILKGRFFEGRDYNFFLKRYIPASLRICIALYAIRCQNMFLKLVLMCPYRFSERIRVNTHKIKDTNVG
jgi:hypothetical protein